MYRVVNTKFHSALHVKYPLEIRTSLIAYMTIHGDDIVGKR